MQTDERITRVALQWSPVSSPRPRRRSGMQIAARAASACNAYVVRKGRYVMHRSADTSSRAAVRMYDTTIHTTILSRDPSTRPSHRTSVRVNALGRVRPASTTVDDATRRAIIIARCTCVCIMRALHRARERERERGGESERKRERSAMDFSDCGKFAADRTAAQTSAFHPLAVR